MALVSKELVEEGSYEQTASLYTLIRVWYVEGEELATTYAGHAGAPHAVRYAPGIPDMTDTYHPGGAAPILKVVSKVGKRVNHTIVQVTVKYEYSKKPGGGTADDAMPEEEAKRRWLYNVPYNERLEYASKEDKVIAGWNPDNPSEFALVNPWGGGAAVYEPRVVWSFTVLTRPVAVDWETIGKYGTFIYPSPPPKHRRRPFRFAENTLLYLGASGGIAMKGDDLILTPPGVPMDWVWEFTYKFAFNPDGWDTAKFLYYIPLTSKAASPIGGVYWDPWAKTENIGTFKPKELQVAFGRYFYTDPSGKRRLQPFETAVMEGVDFHDTFGFNWDWTG